MGKDSDSVSTHRAARTAPAGRGFGLVAAAATSAALLVGSGVAYRTLVEQMDVAMGHTLQLARPFSTLEYKLGPWRGVDVPLPPRVLQQTHIDYEYLSRRYVHTGSQTAVSVYVGLGYPRTQLIHRADICFIASGWNWDSQKRVPLVLESGATVPCILHRFSKPGKPPLLVLATYVVSGRYSDTPAAHSVRDPGLFGKRPAYVVRLQIVVEASRDRAGDVEKLMGFAARVQAPLAEVMPYWVE